MTNIESYLSILDRLNGVRMKYMGVYSIEEAKIEEELDDIIWPLSNTEHKILSSYCLVRAPTKEQLLVLYLQQERRIINEWKELAGTHI